MEGLSDQIVSMASDRRLPDTHHIKHVTHAYTLNASQPTMQTLYMTTAARTSIPGPADASAPYEPSWRFQ